MKLLITGIHGFVGSNLVAAFSQDMEIYGLDIIAPHKEGVVQTFSWNNLEAGNIPEIDTIIHLAGKAHDTKNKSAADVYFNVNTGLTRKVFDYFLQSSAKKFIFFSSVKAAADYVPGEVLTEDIVPAPLAPMEKARLKPKNIFYPKKFLKIRMYIFSAPA